MLLIYKKQLRNMKKNIKKLSQITNNCFFKVIFILFLTSCNESINYSKNNHKWTKDFSKLIKE